MRRVYFSYLFFSPTFSTRFSCLLPHTLSANFLLSASVLSSAFLFSQLCSPILVFHYLVYSTLLIMSRRFRISNLALLNGRNFTGDLPHTPNTSQSQFFNQNSHWLSDRTQNLNMSSDSSPLVSDLLYALQNRMVVSFPRRTYCHLPWSSDSAVFRPTNYCPAATVHIYSRSLSLSASNGESEKSRTIRGLEKELWSGRRVARQLSKILSFSSRKQYII